MQALLITAFKKTPDFESGDELNAADVILSAAYMSSPLGGNPAFQSGEDVIKKSSGLRDMIKKHKKNSSFINRLRYSKQAGILRFHIKKIARATVYYPYRKPVSLYRMRKLKNKYRGKRCFIIGNGPSLTKTDLKLLKNEYTFGTNRLYILFDELGFSTTFFIAADAQIIRQYNNDINLIPANKFLMWKNRHDIRFDSETIFLEQDLDISFKSDVTRKLYTGGSVTYIAMQLAYYMGFNPVILVGVDHAYKTVRKTKDKVKLLPYDKKSHFSPDYYKEGDVWIPPDLQKQEFSYKMARYAYESTGREILDATIGGKLKVFPKVKYLSLFKNT